MTEQDEGLWTVEDVAAYLRLHKQTVYAMCKDSRLPFSRANSQYRFLPQEIRAWVANKQQPAVR